MSCSNKVNHAPKYINPVLYPSVLGIPSARYPPVRYIPPVDTPPYSTYMGCYTVSPPPESRVQNTLGTNPRCPVSMCNQCSGSECNCNLNHMKAPNVRRYWVYKWNQY